MSYDKPMCVGCKSSITNESGQCPRCNLFYHPGCARICKTMEDGAFTKCCKPRSRSPIDPPCSASLTALDVEQIVNRAISTLMPHITEVSTCVNHLIYKFENLNLNVNEAMARLSATEREISYISKRLSEVEDTVNELQTNPNCQINSNTIVRQCIL